MGIDNSRQYGADAWWGVDIKKGRLRIMVHGYIVINHNADIGWSKKYIDKYLALREGLFGYAPEHPQQLIPLGTDERLKVKRIRLTNAHRGLLKTYEEAEMLKEELSKEFTDCSLEIMQVEYPDAEEVRWITA